MFALAFGTEADFLTDFIATFDLHLPMSLFFDCTETVPKQKPQPKLQLATA